MALSDISHDHQKGSPWRHPVFARALGALALLLFCWPFVRVPRPSLWVAYLHLLGSWATVIVVMWWMSQHLAGNSHHPGHHDD